MGIEEQVKNDKLKRTVFGLEFDNPVGFAAGFDKNAEIYNQFSNFGFSFIEIGTVTPKPQAGNPKPRSFRIKKDSGLINRMGFNNKGVEFAANKLKKRHKVIIGGNIGKNTATPNSDALNDYEVCFNELHDHVDYFVVNISCPNVTDLRELQDKGSMLNILGRLKELNTQKENPKPILLKISPDLNNQQLDDVIDIVKETKIDGLVATNTTVTRENLETSDEEVKAIANGGMSGKPITNRSTEVIRYIANKTNRQIPIIGVGGIMTPEDAIEKLEAGASLVQVYTGFIYEGPCFVKKINKAILKSL